MPFPNLDGREPAYNDQAAFEKVKEYFIRKIETGEEKVPTAEGLANFMAVTSKTLKRYSEDKTNYPQFCLSYEILFDTQVKELINGGLENKLNANIVKLMLFNHGYSDRTTVDQTVKAEVKDTTKDPEEMLKDVLAKINDLQKDE